MVQKDHKEQWERKPPINCKLKKFYLNQVQDNITLMLIHKRGKILHLGLAHQKDKIKVKRKALLSLHLEFIILLILIQKAIQPHGDLEAVNAPKLTHLISYKHLVHLHIISLQRLLKDHLTIWAWKLQTLFHPKRITSLDPVNMIKIHQIQE